MTKKSLENEILAKGNNSCKSRSNATKVEFDLYDVKTNSYILRDGRTDRRQGNL